MVYAGNRVFNGNNLIGVAFVLLGLILLIEKDADNFPLIIIPVAVLITSAEAFYFEITTDDLIVKNYMIPFLNIHYRLNEITQIQFLNTGYRSTAKAGVKIIRKDKRSMSFRAASLGIADWQAFVNHLCQKGIRVEIEAVSLKSMIGTPEE